MSDVQQTAREVIGQFLRESRKEKGITTYSIRKKSGLSGEAISWIETGGNNYTIDTLTRYLAATDTYLFFGQKEGKDDLPLDIAHIKKEATQKDPYK